VSSFGREENARVVQPVHLCRRQRSGDTARQAASHNVARPDRYLYLHPAARAYPGYQVRPKGAASDEEQRRRRRISGNPIGQGVKGTAQQLLHQP
jgi:hypothetical protein